MKKKFYSNGKLLLTGEYVVLDGAKALALPTKFGQDLLVEEGNLNEIKWTSYDHDGSIWFDTTFTFIEIENKTTFDNQHLKNRLIALLHEAYLLRPDFLNNSTGYDISTHLTFPKYWGLGTSSTLINNIAQWLNINAFTLLQNSFGGSGYDIACAQNNTPIIYQLEKKTAISTPTLFMPKCHSDLYFVYLNQKQNSQSAIASYIKRSGVAIDFIPKIDAITNMIQVQNDYYSMESLLEEHEIILSTILEQATVKQTRFPDFNGTIKSLGAWGGDFILVMSKENPIPYFYKKGYKTILRYSEMIL